MAIFNSYVTNYQRVDSHPWILNSSGFFEGFSNMNLDAQIGADVTGKDD